MIELVAGEDGIGWTSRLAMIHASIESGGARGFPAPIATRLAKRYGYQATTTPAELRELVGGLLSVLRERLGTAALFGGARPNALDVYAASFLTPLSVIDDTVCPQMIEPLRRAFATARELLGELVPDELWAHRTRMFERFLTLPIRLA